VRADARDLGEDDRRVSGTVKPACSAIHCGLWPTTVGVELRAGAVLAVGGDAEDELLEHALLGGGRHVGVQARELGERLGGDRLVEDDGLLARAHHAHVERLRQHDVVDGAADLGGALDEGGHVAGADAEGGLAARVGGADHRVAAGGEDERDARVVHEGAGGLHRGLLDPLDAVLRGAGGDGRVADDLRRGDGALLGRGWKPKTIGLRVFSAMSDLKIAVEVGFVTGSARR
jgi:hypothetical protein